MKKVNLHFGGTKLRFLFFILIFFVFVFLCLRFIDRWVLVHFVEYGTYHYPPNETIPFFRNGEVEYGNTNQFGIRQPNDLKKINCHYLVLGDSQTFGSGIFLRDRFTELLNSETNCQWINVSVPGYTLENEFSIYQSVQDTISFQKLYLVIYGNDVYETGDTPDFLHFVKRQSWYRNVLTFFLPEYTRSIRKREYFQTVQVRMTEELNRLSNLPLLDRKKRGNPKDSPPIPPNYTSFKTLYSISPNYFYESLQVKSVSSQNWKRWEQIFFRLKENLSKRNVALTLVYIPLDVEFDSSRFAVYKEIGFPLDPNWLTGDAEFILSLQQLAHEFQIPLIDLRPIFRSQTDLLQPEDIHFNEKANRLIADTIKKSL